MRACCGRIARPRTSDGAAASYASPSGRYRFIASHRRVLFPGVEGSPAECGGTPFPGRGADFQPASIVERSEDAKISMLSPFFPPPVGSAERPYGLPFAHDRDLVPGIAASRRLDAAISSLVVIALDIKLLGERITILFLIIDD